MVKSLVLLAGATFLSLIINAQSFPEYGVITEEEKLLKECEFDKEAEAIYLLHEGVSNYNDQYNLITEHHVRIKILKEKGIEYANITIPFYSDNGFEFISDIEGLVINYDSDGNRSEQKLDKKTIYTKKITKYHSQVRFAFPSVKVGSIIEYKYKSTMKSYGGLDDWNFQEELPVKKSTYWLTILPNYEFSYLFYKSPSLPVEVKSDAESGRVYFAMNNVPGLGNEPYMDARKDYLQRVTFKLSGHQTGTYDGFSVTGVQKQKYSSTWLQVIQELMAESSFGGQLNKNLDGTSDFMNLVKASPGDAEKMKLIFNWVRSNMSWNQIYSKSSPEGIKNAWSKKSGTNGDINLILINLLREAGLETYPLLVSERHNGKVNKDYPSIDQFNTVYAMVIINNKKYYLDANDKFTPPSIIPVDILNTTALVVNRKSGGLIDIADDDFKYRDFINVSLEVGENGVVNGSGLLSSSDYARVERLQQYQYDKAKYLEHYFQQYIPGMLIDSFNLKNEENDSLALEHTFSFRYPVQLTGEYVLLPVNLFSGFGSNPFIAANRFTHINFGYRQSVILNAIIHLPKNLVLDEALPKPTTLVNEDKTVVFVRQVFKDESQKSLVVRINIDLKKSLYTIDEYDALKEFYSRMFSLLNEQIVLKKK